MAIGLQRHLNDCRRRENDILQRESPCGQGQSQPVASQPNTGGIAWHRTGKAVWVDEPVKYPEGVACASVLEAGKDKGDPKQATNIFKGILIGALFKGLFIGSGGQVG